MAKWSSSDTGILRKKNQKEKHDDLLVFGYACKLFRDDEKALYIDQGKHLIPWMGNNNLRIDRYDGRGALSELAPYESSKEGYDTMRWLGLSESERKLEQLCDEERYHALHTSEDEEIMYKEEEAKRRLQKEKEFQYNYDVAPDPNANSAQDTPINEEEDKAFVAPPELDVPADIQVPKTVKENARIEKTALFVSQQGPQMEILIKAKQSDNPQFSFMNQNDSLFKYYRHVLSAIKNDRYKIQEGDKKEITCDEIEADNNEDHYLHPSLLTSSTSTTTLGRPVVQVPTPLPQISYKPSADCAYSQLVNRIQGNQNDNNTQSGLKANLTTPSAATPVKVPTTTTPAPTTTSGGNQMTYEQQQYYQYYYTMQYYEYYKQMSQYQGQNYQQGDNNDGAVPQQLQEQIGQQSSTPQFAKQQQQNPYAQIVTNISQNKDGTQSSQSTSLAIDGDKSTNTDISKAPVIYGPSNLESTNFIGPLKPETSTVLIESSSNETKEITMISNSTTKLKPLVHYGTDSDVTDTEPEEDENEESDELPPTDIKIIIDKMASYVSKNGSDFEDIVKSKGDPRFEFLVETHKFHSYYQAKIKEYSTEDIEDDVSTRKSPIKEEIKKEPVENVPKIKEKKIITPVSFSIKKPKEHEVPKEIKSALPIEESDDEVDINKVETESIIVTTPVQTTPQTNHQDEQTSEKESSSPMNETKNNGIIDPDDPILEMIDLTEDAEEKRDAKRAEDRKKDKIAAAAREKLASATRDRALQLERKKRAAAFLKLKSAETDVNVQKDEVEIRIISKMDDKVHTISDSDNSKDESDKLTSTSNKRNEKRDHKEDVNDCGDSKRRRKVSKKRKSHRRRSKSKHDYNRHKKSKKRRRRSESYSSNSSASSQ